MLTGGVHVAEQHAALFELFADVVIDDFRFVLRETPAKNFALGFGDARRSNVFLMSSDVVPRTLGAVGRANEIVNVPKSISERELVFAPRRHRLGKEDVERLQAEVAHFHCGSSSCR